MEYRGILKIGASSSFPLPLHILSKCSKIDLLLYPVIICALFLCFFRFVCVDRCFLLSEETTSESLVDGVADRLTAMIPEKSLFIFNSLSHPCIPKILRRTDRLTMQ